MVIKNRIIEEVTIAYNYLNFVSNHLSPTTSRDILCKKHTKMFPLWKCNTRISFWVQTSLPRWYI